MIPIVLFVYNRLNHTERTVKALSENINSSNSKLFVFSDGAKNEQDNQEVDEVKKYIKTIKGFKSLDIFDRKENNGLAESVIAGVSEIINIYGKVIVLEDDLVTAPNFINFMNDAMTFYEEDEKIMSVTGYSFPLKLPENYEYDIYVSPRPSSWGWGTWKEYWNNTDWEMRDYDEFYKSKKLQQAFNLGGSDLTPMIKNFMNNKIHSWGIRWCFEHFRKSGLSIYPIKSLVTNIGTDGSGTNFTKRTNKYFVELSNKEWEYNFSKDLEMNDKILNSIDKIVSPSKLRKFLSLISY